MAKRRPHKRFISEMNMVPYIDVMLGLLVIFMITVPLLQQGVEVDLPQAASEMMPTEERQPLILTINSEGAYFLNLSADPRQALESEEIMVEAQVALQNDPQLPVLVRADKSVDYGAVIGAMVLLQRAGAAKVGLLTESPETQ
ncbi:MAG: protein TolR [Candidatus Competibacteraceae bacterium]|jgi:biopolymer transport protein TolR|nr:protein TolR [Candidatus Competibacteraceae bacterium]